MWPLFVGVVGEDFCGEFIVLTVRRRRIEDEVDEED